MKANLTVFGLMIASASVLAQGSEYSFREKYSVSVPAQLTISSNDGNIAVEAGDVQEIQVYYVVRKGMKLLPVKNREDLANENVTVEVTAEKSSLSIQVRYKDRIGISSWKDQLNINFRVVTPRLTACDLHSSDGNIEITGLNQNQLIKTSDGNIKVADVQGNVSGSTSDGNVSLRNIVGAIDVGTSDGNIDIANVKGSTAVKTSDGNIFLRDVVGSFRGATSDGDIKGNIVRLERELIAKTGDGSINLTIPDKLGIDFDISGESLDVPLSNFNGRTDEKFIRGKSNGGGIAVNLRSGDGHITVNYAQ